MTEHEDSIVESVRRDLRDMERRIDVRINSIQESIDTLREASIARERRMTDEMGALRESVKRAQEIADKARSTADSTQHEARVVFESIKAHNALLERRIQSFESTLNGVAEENRVQTATLAELASEAEERSRRGIETQNLVKTLQAQNDQIIIAERAREQREAIAAALQKERETRQETIWKRVPVYIALVGLLTGGISWIVTSLVREKMPPQIIYVPKSESSVKP